MEQIIDSRICVKVQEVGFTVDHQDISVPDAREVMRRLAAYVRQRDMTGVQTLVPAIEGYDVHPAAEGELPRVCIAYDYVSGHIQCAVTGLNDWNVCVLLDNAASYFEALLLGLIKE